MALGRKKAPSPDLKRDKDFSRWKGDGAMLRGGRRVDRRWSWRSNLWTGSSKASFHQVYDFGFQPLRYGQTFKQSSDMISFVLHDYTFSGSISQFSRVGTIINQAGCLASCRQHNWMIDGGLRTFRQLF